MGRVSATGGARGRAACIRTVAVAALALALAGAGCGEPNVLLVTVAAERPVQSLDFLVRDQAAGAVIDQHVNVPLGDQDISQAGQGLKIAERFSKPGTYLIHVVGRDAQGLQVATRAYAVEGAVEVSLKLVGLTAATDADGDGFPSADGCAQLAAPGLDCAFADCDDHDAATNPFAVERCNGKDDNCDGKLPADEADQDGDGFLACTDCDPNGADWNPDLWDCRDCDDTRADVHPASRRDPKGHPAAPEDCHTCGDHLDHNCDGKADEGCNDHDCDGYPACGAPDAPAPPLCDCNDNDPNVHPGAAETCGDAIDNNCDGQTDEGCLPCDLDGDGFLRDDPANGCNPPAGQADCDDTDAAIKPGAADSCGGKEGGCRDMALRGYCHYTNAADPPIVHDCTNRLSGAGAGCPPRDCDHDGDGFMRYDPANGCNPPTALADCNDEDSHVFPGAPDYCGNGIAENCQSDLPCDNDQDGDHYNAGDDCDDTNPLIHPWALEVCDGVDNDCDGLVDEGNPNATSGATVSGLACTDSNRGECGTHPGICVCSRTTPSGVRASDRAACPDENLDATSSPRCFGAGQPRAETIAATCTGPNQTDCTCNGLDDDCDGVADDAPGEVPCPAGTACSGAGGAWKCGCGPASGCDGCCTAQAYLDRCTQVAELSVAECGIAGAPCTGCDDGNACTTDSCDGACHHVNLPEHAGCPGGQCRVPAAQAGICCGGCWTGTSCVDAPAAGCGTAGGDCAPANTSCGRCKVCDGAGGCGNVAANQDPNNECADDGAASCGKRGVCDGNGACALYAAGTSCATCKTCDGSGHCGNVTAGQDPNNECADDGAASCGKNGACNGSGACQLYPAGTACALCKTCDGSGHCNNVTAGQDPNNQCQDQGAAGCGQNGACNGSGACQLYPAGTACAPCKECDGAGHCSHNVAVNTDPHNDCTSQAQSTCGLTGNCDGNGACQVYASGTSCGTCKTCNGSQSCNVMPADDSNCPVVTCSPTYDTACATANSITTNRCATLGTCKTASAATCTSFTPKAPGTGCGTCKTCDSSGGCTVMPLDDPACPALYCPSYSTACITYSDITNRCKSLGTCKTAPADCTAFTIAGPGTACATCKTCDSSGGCTQNVSAGGSSSGACTDQGAASCGTNGKCDGAGGCQKYAAGTVCSECHQCDGNGSCVPAPNGTACGVAGNKICCGGTCCNSSSACADGGGC
jgi:hypothetical protein